MNRENKRKQYEKGYYKTHACNETFTCRAREAAIGITVRIVFTVCMWISSRETGSRIAAGIWNRYRYGFGTKENGLSFIGAKCAEALAPIGLQQMIIL